MTIPMNFEQLVNLCHQTQTEIQSRAIRSVDLFLVVRNWLFGCHIVEYEQRGGDKAAYGAGLMNALAARLRPLGIKGVSPTRLRLYRSFYREFSRIRPTLSVEFASSISGPEDLPTLLEALSHRFTLGWSHYVELLTLDDAAERQFYEIETATNQWSVRELQRQMASSLYQRLALSRDKNEIRRLATEGQVVEKAADLIKNPLVLEFLGLQEHPHYSEDELESAIIDKLESFLLELGKGFLFEAR